MRKYIPVLLKNKEAYVNIEYLKELEKENEEIKEKLELTENDRDEWKVKATDLKRYVELLEYNLKITDELNERYTKQINKLRTFIN